MSRAHAAGSSAVIPAGYWSGLWRYAWQASLLLGACLAMALAGLLSRCYSLIAISWVVYAVQGTRLGIKFRRNVRKGVKS